MIAAVTDLDGNLTGLQRTYLARDGHGKAPVSEPRRAMGNLLGCGVRFGIVADILAAGEGIETVLSLRSILPSMPMLAGLSSAHLAAILLPAALRRLYILRDNDAAGGLAVQTLAARCLTGGIEARVLTPITKDLNLDLCREGAAATRAHILPQLVPEDLARFSPLNSRACTEASCLPQHHRCASDAPCLDPE